ncbi:non-ribosomal peptide synthetase [Bradyrhizobium sp. B117]|uniref:non-ribosomal peptide synthetase n=1 Tax=Bradyrhizobium sp. B117 TaxID=3140246 RepID=UPI0031841CFD
MTTRSSKFHAEVPLKASEGSAAGVVRPFVESVADGIEWKAVPERPLDDGGPNTPFKALPHDFPDTPAIEHLARIVECHPQKICVDDGTHQLTFAQLHAAVVKLANLLSELVPAGQAVGLLMPNCVWQPVAMLACMAANRPCLPLNCRDPVSRNVDISTDAGLTVVIGCMPDAPPSFADLAHLRWINIASLTDQGHGAAPSLSVSVDDPALILYTSGSTGRPKGIVNSQRSLLQRVLQYVNASHLSHEDVFFPLSGPTTIAGCREMLTSLLIGARLYVADLEAAGLHGTLRAIGSQRATVIYSVPTLLRTMISAGKYNDFQSVRILRIGGEKILTADIEFFRRAMPRAYVQIGYSSTETTGSQCFVPTQFAEGTVTTPVGYLLPGISFAVVDDNGASVPQGECGELMISSRFVTLGRWEKGALIPARSDPKDPTRRIHATGDLVFFDDREVMHVVGRKDRQIKINGKRIEPAELEVAVRQIPHVADAVVVVTAANELVTFVVLEPNSGIPFPGAIWEVIRKTVPGSLHPKRLHEVADIPRLGSGKIDVVTLRARDAALIEPVSRSPDELHHARSAVEQVWKRVLGTRSAVGSWDEAGGDSLQLLRLVMELEDLIGTQLDLGAFTLDADVARMAAAAADALSQDADVDCDHPTKPPLFLVPGSIGFGPSLTAFGATLDDVAQVTTLRYPALSTAMAGQSEVTDMAAAAMDQIHRIQPSGDVRLLSYSLGGGVAFEIARQLIAEGRKVRFFGVLDTNVGNERSGYVEGLSRTLQRIRTHRVTIYRMICRSISKAFVRVGREQLLMRALEFKQWSFAPATHFMLKLEAEEVLRMRAFRRWVGQAHQQLPITATLFSCRRAHVSARMGWDRLVERLDVIPVNGGHLDLVVEPHLSINQPLIERALIATYGKPVTGRSVRVKATGDACHANQLS